MRAIKNLFLKQKMMRRVLISLIPVILYATYIFGLRVLTLLAVVTFFAVLCEYLVARTLNPKNIKVSEAVIVTSFLYTLSLPPATPYYIAVIGILFGVLFGKMAFGGFGKNVFNPAMVARCFIYISFPSYLTITWSNPFSGFPGGILNYSKVDAITNATPILSMKNNLEPTSYLDMFVGNTPGAIGATSALLLLISGIYLVYTKTASFKLMYSTFFSYSILYSIFYYTDIVNVDPLTSILSGGLMFGVVYIVTEPISAPKQEVSKIIYGALIGALTVVISTFSVFAGAVMFSVIIGNTFAPLIDKYVNEFKVKRRVASNEK